MTTRVQALEIRDQSNRVAAPAHLSIVAPQPSQAVAHQPQVAVRQPPPARPEPRLVDTSVNPNRTTHIERSLASTSVPSPAPHQPPPPQVSTEDLRTALNLAVGTAVAKFQMTIQHHIQRGEETLQQSERRMQARLREDAARLESERRLPIRRPARSGILSRAITREQRLVQHRAEQAARLHERRLVGPVDTEDV